jgi:hypothetical protein
MRKMRSRRSFWSSRTEPGSSETSFTENTRKTAREPLQLRGVVVDEVGRPVAGVSVRADAFRNNETRAVTGADGSFAIPIRGPGLEGRALLAQPGDGNRLGFFHYEYVLTKAQADAPARIVLKAGREVIVTVTDASKAPVPPMHQSRQAASSRSLATPEPVRTVRPGSASPPTPRSNG